MSFLAKFMAFFALVLGMLTSTPAAAQLDKVYQTGSRIAVPAEDVEANQVRIMLKDMARCVYSRHPKVAVKLLKNSDQYSIDYLGLGFGADEFGDEFSLDECLGRAMTQTQLRAQFRFHPQLLRTLLAEEAYLADHKKALTLPEGSEEVMSTRTLALSPNLRQVQAISGFADCIVFNGSSQADELMRTNPASKREMEAINALLPAVSACLFEGQEFSLTPQSIRDMVADGLWSRSYYPAPDTTAQPDIASETSN